MSQLIDQWFFYFDFFHLEIQDSDSLDSGFQIQIVSLRLTCYESKLRD